MSDPREETVEAGGVTLGIERFGDPADPLVLLVGAPTILSWPDALCRALADGGRQVVRYDLRDSGASTTLDPEKPGYTLRDLPPTPRPWPRRSTADRRTWPASTSAGWSPRSPRSTIRTPSRP